MKGRLRTKCGFTLIELLVVLSVIALMLTIALPNYFHSIDASKDKILAQNLHATRDAIDILYERTGEQFLLIDTAGMRARSKHSSSVEVFSVMRAERTIRRADLCILVRGRKPVFVLLCDAEELLHLIRSWRCWRPVRIEWPCELAEEAVEFQLAHSK